MLNPWLALTLRTIQLGLDAQNVIFLRMMRISAGGVRGRREASRMISEKIAAGMEAQATAASGVIAGRNDVAVASRVVRVVQKRVRANKRRLSRR
jgi:hypothetical protein